MRRTWLGPIAAAALATLIASDTQAQGRAQELMPPSTNIGFFTGGIGPTFFGLVGGEYVRGTRRLGLRRARFKFAMDLGWHLTGEGEGPALGLGIEQDFDDQFYVFNPSFKFWWDIQVVDDLAIYVTPFAKAGYALGAFCEFCDDGIAGHAFNLGAGVEGRIVFDDRWMVYFRPVQLDTFLGDFFDETFLLNYSILVGGGLTF
jgi:hypothetical protein